MLTAYIDRGAKKQAGGVMCITTALFQPFYYDLFLHEWQPFLDGWGADAFHATDFYTGGKNTKFKRKRPDGTLDPELVARYEHDSARIPIVLGKYVHQLFVMSFRADEFEAVAPPLWKKRFGSLNRVAVQMAFGAIGHWANKAKYDGEILYFYESGDDFDAGDVQNAFARIYSDPKLRKHSRMAATPVGVAKGKARGLEAADFIAWHWNKYYAETHHEKKRPPRKDLVALLNFLDEKRVQVHLVTEANLVNFLVENGCTARKRPI